MAGYVTLMGTVLCLFGARYLLYAGSSGLQYLGLFLFSTVVWLMVTCAALAEKALEAARTGKPAGGVSVLQDLAGGSVAAALWTVGVVGLHAMLGTYILFGGVRSCWALHRLEAGWHSDDAPVH